MGLANTSPAGSAKATEKSSCAQETAKGGQDLSAEEINLVGAVCAHQVWPNALFEMQLRSEPNGAYLLKLHFPCNPNRNLWERDMNTFCPAS